MTSNRTIVLLLTVCGVSCNTMPPPAAQVALDCANNLDAGVLGFTLSVPPEFACTSVFPNSVTIALVGYRNPGGILVAVQVFRSQGQSNGVMAGDGASVQEGDAYTNPQAILFTQFRTDLLGRVVLGSTTPLAGGNNLFITVTGPEGPELSAIRQSIVDTVALVP